MMRPCAELILLVALLPSLARASGGWNTDAVNYRIVPPDAAIALHEKELVHAELMRSLARSAELFGIMPPETLTVVIHASSRSLIAAGLRSDTRAIFHVPTQTIHLLHPRILGAVLSTTMLHECLHWALWMQRDIQCDIPEELLPETLAPSIRTGKIRSSVYPGNLRKLYAGITADLNSSAPDRMRAARQRLHRWGSFLVANKGERWLARYCAGHVTGTEADDLYHRFRSVQ